MMFTRITAKPRQMLDIPCVRGLRIPVATVLGLPGGRRCNSMSST